MRANELPRRVLREDVSCTGCDEIIEAGEIHAVYQGKPYCECCVEDYEEEGRPL